MSSEASRACLRNQHALQRSVIQNIQQDDVIAVGPVSLFPDSQYRSVFHPHCASRSHSFMAGPSHASIFQPPMCPYEPAAEALSEDGDRQGTRQGTVRRMSRAGEGPWVDDLRGGRAQHLAVMALLPLQPLLPTSNKMRRYGRERMSSGDKECLLAVPAAASTAAVPASAPVNCIESTVALCCSQLTREVTAFVTLVDGLEEQVAAAKRDVLTKVRAVVQSLWPRAQARSFGSFVTGLSLPSSDLDLVICLPKVHHGLGPESAGVLEGRNAIKQSWQQSLVRCLCKEDWVDAASIKVIDSATIPVIKLRTKAEDASPCHRTIALDISFEGPGNKGLEANKLICSLIKAHAPLRPLVIVLKYFLTRKSLCESFTGGLSSYALVLMAARFLQETESASKFDSCVTDLGALLLGMLTFYGDMFVARETGVSVRRHCYFRRSLTNLVLSGVPAEPPLGLGMWAEGGKDDRRHGGYCFFNDNTKLYHKYRPQHSAASPTMSQVPFKFDPLFVEDPLEPRNNVGRNCFRIFQVQRVLSEAAATMTSRLRLLDGTAAPAGLLQVLVGSYDEIT